ncbi:MAG TPA: M20/M25/M40 family metallo-hydrolase [Polyangia bacterium]|jgi:acetylornithine deacetylase|nr:M20/M25/M40 family metallo-hydrolase [Polyangia bacterium]
MGLLERLAELVSFDTRNPEGDEKPLVHKLARELGTLGAAAVDEVDVGDHSYVYARFGAERPTLLLNAHVDTVPANTGYSAPPHILVRRGDRLHGLGACDTKGAIAAILEALAARGPLVPSVGVLFSGDEERGGSCIRAFLESDAAHGLTHAIVCEPTRCRVGVRHRGIGAATATLEGPGGHSSRVDGIVNPIAALARAAVALDDWREAERHRGPAGFEGLCLNVASLEGGLAFNVVPTRATLAMSLRPAPGADLGALLAEAERRVRAATAPHAVTWTVETESPPFATRALGGFAPYLGPAAAGAVDLAFWTEAARISERGLDAVVYGPGDIAQAHAADEFVTIAELESARATFAHVLQAAAR